MAEADWVFENKLTMPGSEVSRSMLGSSTFEEGIIWREGGIRDRLAELENQMASLGAVLTQLLTESRQDLLAAPEVDATVFYETASDGTLRSGVEISVEGSGLVEVAMLEAPTVEYASKDATVDEGNPTTNYDTKLECGLDASGNELWPLAAFSWGTWGASPTGLWAADPVLALVRLAKNGTSDDEMDLEIYPVDRDEASWSESTVTWNTRPDAETIALDARRNDPDADYCYFDITAYIKRALEMKQGSWAGVPEGFYLKGSGPDLGDGDSVTFYTKAEATADRKPQVWYWESVYKSQVLGGSTRQAKFYGAAGGSYWLVYRFIDRSNNPGRWSAPVAVTLPSQGATPYAPAAAPTIEATNFSNVKRIILTTSVPADIAVYEIELYCSAETKYIKTTSDRLEVNFNSGSTYRDYQVRYRFVTRSGKTSNWSSYCTSFRVTKELKIQRADASDGTAYVLIDSDGDTHLFHASGSSSRTYDYVESQARLLLLDVVKGVAYNNISASCGQASNDSSQNITGTSWIDRTTGSITLTPPGSGNAYYLLIARATISKGTSTGIRLSFKVDGTQTNDEEAWASADSYETVTIVRRVAVTAGSSHTFKLVAKAADANTAIIGKSNVVALHLGNY